MLVYAIMTNSARLCAARVEFACRTLQRPAQPNLRRAQETQQPTTRFDAHKVRNVSVLNKLGRKRCPRKDDAFPVAGPLGAQGAYVGAGSRPVRTPYASIAVRPAVAVVSGAGKSAGRVRLARQKPSEPWRGLREAAAATGEAASRLQLAAALLA